MTAFKRIGQITDTSAADRAAVVRARAALADAQALLDRIAQERDEKAAQAAIAPRATTRTSQHGSATPDGLVRLAGAVVASASIAWPIVDRTGFAPAVLGSLGFALGACVALFAHK
jgi:rhamnose utilization protein RhaD (predicted bifunctional aldolase and dehydrogenase)